MQFNEDFEMVCLKESLDAVRKYQDWSTVPQSIIANWIAKHYPVNFDTPDEYSDIIAGFEEFLLFRSESIVSWLSNFDGRPALIANSSTTLSLVNNDTTQELLENHSDVVYEHTGVGPKETASILREEIEVSMMRRDVSLISSQSLLAVSSITVAAKEGLNVQDALCIQRVLNVATILGHSLVRHKIIAQAAERGE